MILTDSIEKTIKNNNKANPLYLRNLIKEEIQNYILNFVFSNNKYNDLIFTGGTCLRKVYGLNRISEDLDFDYVNGFQINGFAKDVKKYFKSSVQYKNLRYSISKNKKTVYFKLPILKELDVYKNRTPEDIFVRCDFSEETKGSFKTDQNMISAGPFQFFVTSYDLSTLFANKIAAFLERVFYKGKFQKIPFKGRDVYDLFWLVQLSGKSSFELKANPDRLKAILNKSDIDSIKNEVLKKITLIEDKFLYDDLYPLVESKDVLKDFIASYKDYLAKYMDFIL